MDSTAIHFPKKDPMRKAQDFWELSTLIVPGQTVQLGLDRLPYLIFSQGIFKERNLYQTVSYGGQIGK